MSKKKTPNTTVKKKNKDNEKSNEILRKLLQVMDNEIEAFIDSGSDRSLIRRSFAIKIYDTEKCSVALNGIAGGKYECTTFICATMDVDENRLTT